jgi:hypothetical protein
MTNEPTIEARRHARRMYKIVKSLAERVTDEYDLTEQEAISCLYHSQLYKLLSDEETKVWWYSVLVLFELFQKERESGTLEGASYLHGLTG